MTDSESYFCILFRVPAQTRSHASVKNTAASDANQPLFAPAPGLVLNVKLPPVLRLYISWCCFLGICFLDISHCVQLFHNSIPLPNLSTFFGGSFPQSVQIFHCLYDSAPVNRQEQGIVPRHQRRIRERCATSNDRGIVRILQLLVTPSFSVRSYYLPLQQHRPMPPKPIACSNPSVKYA